MSKEDFLQTIYVASGKPKAEIIKGRLECEGIPVLLSYESYGLVLGVTLDGLGQVKVQVPSSFADKAREVIDTSEEEI